MAAWVGFVARALAAAIIAITTDAAKDAASKGLDKLTTPPPDTEPVKQCLVDAYKHIDPLKQVISAEEELTESERALEEALSELASQRAEMIRKYNYDPESKEFNGDIFLEKFEDETEETLGLNVISEDLKEKTINLVVKNRAKRFFNKIRDIMNSKAVEITGTALEVALPSTIAPDSVVDYIEAKNRTQRLIRNYERSLTLYTQSLSRLPSNVDVIRVK
jgi:hypothetical protein